MDAVRRVRGLLRPLLVFGFSLLSGAAAADFSLSNFTLESSERVFGIPAPWDLTYRADVTNQTVDDYTDLRLVIEDPPGEIEVIDDALSFGDVPAGTTVQLDWTGSRDPKNVPLTYAWSLTSMPQEGSSIQGEELC